MFNLFRTDTPEKGKSLQWWCTLAFLQGAILYVMAAPFAESTFAFWQNLDPNEIIRATLGYVVVGLLPLMYFISGHFTRKLAAAFVLLAGLHIAFFTLSDPVYRVEEVLFMIAVAWLLLPWFKAEAEGKPLQPVIEQWFRTCWTHGLHLCLSGLFVLITIGLMWLVYGLFDVIGISFYSIIMHAGWFVGAFAFALILRKMFYYPSVLSGKNILNQLFARLLITPLSLIVLLFFPLAIFGNLHTFGNTDYPAWVLIIVTYGYLLVVNIVLLDEEWVARANNFQYQVVRISLLVLPAFCLLALYAVWLRIGQHGLTPTRIYALLIILLDAVVCISYAATALKMRERLMHFQRINGMTGLSVCALMVLLVTPVSNPYIISANHQLHRLMTEQVKADEFDYSFLQYYTGEYGNTALEQLTKIEDHPEAAKIRTQAAMQLAGTPQERFEMDVSALAERIVMMGQPFDVAQLPTLVKQRCFGSQYSTKPSKCYIIATQISGDATPELLVYVDYQSAMQQDYSTRFDLEIYSKRASGDWYQSGNMLAEVDMTWSEFSALLEKRSFNPVPPVPPAYKDLMMGGVRFITRVY